MASKKKKFGTPFRIPDSLRSPIREHEEITVSTDAEYVFFLRCFELYRVIELSDRMLESMFEAYSKYRTRDLFKETLHFRNFDFSAESLEGIDPGLNSAVLAMFNLIYELRISLLHEDALPFTVKTRIESALAELKREWNALIDGLESRYRWRLKPFPLSQS